MTHRSFTVLVNPNAGGGAAPRVVVPLARRLREAGAEVEVSYTSSPAVAHDFGGSGSSPVVACSSGSTPYG